MNEHYPFETPPLPYAYDALEPYISTETLQYHHDKHFTSYVENLNKVLASRPEYHAMSLEELLCNSEAFPEELRQSIFNYAGGVYNHAVYFASMTNEPTKPSQELTDAIEQAFGSIDACISQMKAAAMTVFGSGYAWLAANKDGSLTLITTRNQDTPLSLLFTPLLPVDVWEHAYYLQNQNRRDEYLAYFSDVINWDAVSRRYSAR